MNSKDKSFHGSRKEGLHRCENQLRYGPKSYSSLSMDDCCNNNFSAELYQTSLDRIGSTSALGNCTGKRIRKYSGEWPESAEKSSVFGSLSENLSRESVRKACGYVDDLSDNDLIEVHNTPGNFQYRLPSKKKLFLDGKFFMKRKKSEENPLCMDGCQLNGNSLSHQEAAFDALRELDAVLDIHDASYVDSYCSASHTESESEQTNIEDCLLDLDDYLDKMDENTFIDYNKETNRNFSNNNVSNSNKLLEDIPHFTRGDNLRKTVGCAAERRGQGSVFKQSQISKCTPSYASLRHSCRRSPGALIYQKNLESLPVDIVEGEIDDMRNSNESGYDDLSRNCDVRRCFSHSDCSDRYSANSTHVLTEDQIFQNLIEQNESQRADIESRPRQYGRRAERNSRVSMPDGNNSDNFTAFNSSNLRPMSAPAITSSPIPRTGHLSHNSTVYVGSDGSTGRSSRNTSPVTILSSSDSTESSTSNNIIESGLVNEDNAQQSTNPSIDPDNNEITHKPGFNMYWPHNYSRTLALLSCTLGLFNVCRFAVLTVNYGPNFLIQFLLLSIIFGIPFFWLQMCLGAKIKAGPVSMWKISPICSGIGISLVLVQYFISIYSSVVVVWLLVYMSDSFMYQSSYRWSETTHFLIPRNSSQSYYNLTESVPDYFNINVLQRLQILKLAENNGIRIHISDRLAFYLAILWATVFLILCKGLKSFGKVLFVIGVLPLITLAVVTGKLLYVVDLLKLQNVFSSSELDDFLINSKTWTSAAQETFLTWGLLGSSIIAITSRGHKNKSKTTLRRDAILVVLLTLIGLCLAALMGLCCIEILNQSGYVYVPGSYEKPGCYSSVYSLKSSPSIDIISYPAKLVPHYSSVIGEVYRRQKDVKNISGYQVLRFVSELFPAVLAIAGNSFSWMWAAVVFIMLFVFGIAQLCVMWKPISSALGNSTSAVLLSCVTGLLLSIPFATEVGITLLHYMDSLIGGAWFIPILWAAEIFGVFLIRGRPYNGDDLVNDLKMSGSMSAFLALSWNVLLPISLITLAVIEYKISLSSQLYYWRGRSYYTYWARKVGALTQIGFLLLVPITSIIQIYRYLTSGPPDILDRIQMLYRPLEGLTGARALNRDHRDNLDSRSRSGRNGNHAESGASNLQDDAPPKYTPPPSYTTATGARLAKMLRQSIRRSVRRILGDSGRSRPILSIQMEQSHEHPSFPPDYSSVLTNPSGASNDVTPSISEIIEISNRPAASSLFGRSLSLGRKNILRKHRLSDKTNSCHHHSTAPRSISGDTDLSRSSSTARPYTAEDVITILRSSTRGRNGTSQIRHTQNQHVFRSIENLVLNAEPPGISASVVTEHLNENDHNNTSVI